jgi:hypothetical protein
LMVLTSAERLLRSVHPQALIYPYEEKGLERSLLQAARSASPPVRTVGFAHALHSRGHMFKCNRPTKEFAHPLPDVIGTTGPTAREWLHSWGGHPLTRLMTVGSPRYTEPLPPPNFDRDPPQVLVIISVAHELPALAAMVKTQPDIFSGWELVIRRYPYGWNEAQDLGIARLKEYGVRLKVEGGPLKEQLEQMRAVIFCATSAGLESQC